MPVSNKEKCICQICICGEHRCEPSKSQFIESHHKSDHKFEEQIEAKVEEQVTESKLVDNNQTTDEEFSSSEQRERSRRQWETSPDQMKEISRSLSKINGDKKEQNLIRSKRSTKENLIQSKSKEPIRPTLPPIANYNSDSDSGKEVFSSCICEEMYKTNGDSIRFDSNQWVVTRPVRNRPKDNLRLEGPMELETTFNTTYDSTAKQINETNSKNIAIVMPSKTSLEENNSEMSQKKYHREGVAQLTAVKASKKKAKHRPSTSLKTGGDGYFNTINKESYKNFVIIDDKSRAKAISANGKTNICCSTVSNIKLPKVDSNNREEHQKTRRLSREEKDIQAVDQMNESMQRLTTSDRYESRNTQTNGFALKFVDTSVQTNYNFNQTNGKSIEISKKSKAQENNEKTTAGSHPTEGTDVLNSWTIGQLEEHKRFYTRDVDNIKELGLLDEPNEHMIREIQESNEKQTKTVDQIRSDRSSHQQRNESSMSKHYVQPQTRLKKHKNESSMKFFEGDMEFMTTSRAYFVDKSPNRAESRPLEREKTAGKRSRKSGRKRNLFRTSTEAQFYEPYGEHKLTETTYQKQFGDRLYCPAIDLGSNKSEFRYRGEASGHKFFLPAVDN